MRYRVITHMSFLALSPMNAYIDLNPWITPLVCVLKVAAPRKQRTKTLQAAVIAFRRDGAFILLNPKKTMRKWNKATVTPCSSSTSSNSDEEL